MQQYAPPIVLVNTWLQLISLSSEKEARTHALKMINNNFGSIDLALDYLKQCELKKAG